VLDWGRWNSVGIPPEWSVFYQIFCRNCLRLLFISKFFTKYRRLRYSPDKENLTKKDNKPKIPENAAEFLKDNNFNEFRPISMARDSTVLLRYILVFIESVWAIKFQILNAALKIKWFVYNSDYLNTSINP
jgi:hypothetical protein